MTPEDKHIDRLLRLYAESYSRWEYNIWNVKGDQRDSIINSNVREMEIAKKNIVEYFRKSR